MQFYQDLRHQHVALQLAYSISHWGFVDNTRQLHSLSLSSLFSSCSTHFSFPRFPSSVPFLVLISYTPFNPVSVSDQLGLEHFSQKQRISRRESQTLTFRHISLKYQKSVKQKEKYNFTCRVQVDYHWAVAYFFVLKNIYICSQWESEPAPPPHPLCVALQGIRHCFASYISYAIVYCNHHHLI